MTERFAFLLSGSGCAFLRFWIPSLSMRNECWITSFTLFWSRGSLRADASVRFALPLLPPVEV